MKGNEIVQALRCCAKGLGHDDACENCKVGEIQDRREYIEFAAANVIERLTAENAALREKQAEAEAERDAAIVDLKIFAAHPRKTRQSEFLKMFPNARIESDGMPSICPIVVDKRCHNKDDDALFCLVRDEEECRKCRRDFWLAEIPEGKACE